MISSLIAALLLLSGVQGVSLLQGHVSDAGQGGAAGDPAAAAQGGVRTLQQARTRRRAPGVKWWHETGVTFPNASSPDYLAMCLIVRDQKEDLLEWIEHYLNLGAGKIYVFDHASNPPVLPAFAPLVEAGFVEYHWMTTSMMQPVYKDSLRRDGRISPQCWVYHDCLRRYAKKHHWMGFLDSDEFIVLKDKTVPSLPAFLQDFEEYGGLVVNWMMFGSSGHVTRPDASTLAAYTKCFKLKYVKTIANTKYAWATSNDPHTFRYRDNTFAVNERKQRQNFSVTPTWVGDKIVLNHYVTKSKAQSVAKSLRGDGNGSGKPLNFFDLMDRYSVENCTNAVDLMAGRSYLARLPKPIPGLISPQYRVKGVGLMEDVVTWNSTKGAGRHKRSGHRPSPTGLLRATNTSASNTTAAGVLRLSNNNASAINTTAVLKL